MASPKHLWSGDWERESAARAVPPNRPPSGPPLPDGAEPDPDGPEPGLSRGTRWLLGGTAGLLIATVAAVLAVTLGGHDTRRAAAPRPAASAQAPVAPFGSGGATPTVPVPTVPIPVPTVPTPTVPTTPATPNSGGAPLTPSTPAPAPTRTVVGPAVSGPVYEWLGMELSPSGAGVSVAAVADRGQANADGVDPGDVISSVAGQPVDTMEQLRRVAGRLPRGHRFGLIVLRGTTQLTLSATAADPPRRGS